MTNVAPPDYNQANQEIPPVYPELEQPIINETEQIQPQLQEVEPPPVQFGEVAEPVYAVHNQPQSLQGQPVIVQVVQQQPIIIQAPPVTNGGETYQDVPTTSGPVYVADGIGGEAHVNVNANQHNGCPGDVVYYDARGRHGSMLYKVMTLQSICFPILLP